MAERKLQAADAEARPNSSGDPRSAHFKRRIEGEHKGILSCHNWKDFAVDGQIYSLG